MQVLLQDIKKIETGAIIVGFFEDVRPLKGLAGELDWLLCGALSRLIINKKPRRQKLRNSGPLSWSSRRVNPAQ